MLGGGGGIEFVMVKSIQTIIYFINGKYIPVPHMKNKTALKDGPEMRKYTTSEQAGMVCLEHIYGMNRLLKLIMIGMPPLCAHPCRCVLLVSGLSWWLRAKGGAF